MKHWQSCAAQLSILWNINLLLCPVVAQTVFCCFVTHDWPHHELPYFQHTSLRFGIELGAIFKEADGEQQLSFLPCLYWALYTVGVGQIVPGPLILIQDTNLFLLLLDRNCDTGGTRAVNPWSSKTLWQIPEGDRGWEALGDPSALQQPHQERVVWHQSSTWTEATSPVSWLTPVPLALPCPTSPCTE